MHETETQNTGSLSCCQLGTDRFVRGVDRNAAAGQNAGDFPATSGLNPLAEAVPDNTMTLPQQLSQILQGAFSAEGERSVTLTLSEQQLNELADQTLAEWLGSVQIKLQSGQIAVQIQLHQPDELIRQFPQLGEYGSLLQLAGDSPIRILMQTDEKRKLPLALQQLAWPVCRCRRHYWNRCRRRWTAS